MRGAVDTGAGMRRLIGLGLVLLVSACVAPRQPAPPPPPPTPTPPPPPAPAPPPADWRDLPYTPGDWSYARAGGVSEASYGSPGAVRLALVCDPRAGQVRLSWRGASGPVTIRTTYGDTVRQSQVADAGARLLLGPRDPLLDQIAYSRGRFMLAAGGQVLIAPVWPEIARVIEDCR
jgi:hypothetical protein